MKYGEDLVNAIASSELLERAKVLKQAIESAPHLQNEYQNILDLQKRLVGADAKGETARAAMIRAQYERQLAALRGSEIVSEYLDILGELNEIAQETAEILTQGLKR